MRLVRYGRCTLSWLSMTAASAERADAEPGRPHAWPAREDSVMLPGTA